MRKCVVKKFFVFAAACILALGLASVAAAAEYPSRAISLSLSRAGSQVDYAARVFAKTLNKYLNVSVIVNNTSGPVEGMRTMLGAAPDGYSLNWSNNSIYIHDVMGTTDFNTVEDCEPVGVVARKDGTWIAIKKELADKGNIKTLTDLFEYTKKHPGELVIADAPASVSHVEYLELAAAGLEATPAAVGDANRRLTNFLGGNCDIFVGVYSLIDQYVKRGDVVCLASMSDTRSKYTPDIPCTGEMGYKTNAAVFYVVSAPKGTPREVIDKLSAAFRQVTEDPDYAADLEKNMIEPAYMNADDTAKFVKEYKAELIRLGMADN